MAAGDGSRGVLHHIWAWRTVLILFLTPLIILPLPLVVQSPKTDCAYVVILMAVYWITESLPVGVTALIPVFLFPLLGLVSADDVAKQYMNDINMVFLGGLTMAVAIEYWNIHKRVALLIILRVGTEPRWLMLGMMIATWFLSMWISNTATTAMMVPIAEAILQQLKITMAEQNQDEDGVEMQDVVKEQVTVGTDPKEVEVSMKTAHQKTTDDDISADSVSDKQVKNEDPAFARMCKGMSLCICYAANSGGIASLTGTGPNLVLKGHADTIYQDHGIKNPVTFGSWMAFGLPLSVVVVFVCWCWLQILYLRCRGCGRGQNKQQRTRVRQVIVNEYEKLGPMIFGQVMVIICFLVLVTLWITRDLGGIGGWGSLFDYRGPPSSDDCFKIPKTFVKDAAPAILIGVLLFALPSTIPCLKSYGSTQHPETWDQRRNSRRGSDLVRVGPLEIRPLLNWRIVHQKMPWQLFLLLGGGYALSKGCKDSGLSGWIGDQLVFFQDWNQWLILLIICYITAGATEVTSNTAIATLLMPIMSELAITTNVHPLNYMFPAALACSFAFMLPVATPPNAIVFAYGRIKIIDMASAGLMMNILAVPILVAATGTLGNAIFDFDNVPGEFLNSTIKAATLLSNE